MGVDQLLAAIAEFCGIGAQGHGIAATGSGWGLVPALFVAGLAGSLLHCLPMCGPFVMGQASARMACILAGKLCGATRLRAGLLLPYHAGRMLTYAALGALATLPASLIGGTRWAGPFSSALLAIAALLFLAEAARRLSPGMGARAPAAARLMARATNRLARHLPRGPFVAGLLLGLLPCGFLYGAVAVAGASADPLRGAVAMAAFAAGTAPTLILLAIGGELAARRFNFALGRAAPAVLFLNAVLLAALAWRGFTA